MRNLKCIKVTMDGEDNGMLTFNEFDRSFIQERWKGERRTQRTYTIFGDVHQKTTVTSPCGNKSVRTFDFPSSVEEAEARDIEYKENNKF